MPSPSSGWSSTGSFPASGHDAPERARRLDLLQRTESEFDPIPFDAEAARQYGRIVAAARQTRSRTVDLMIAATAIAHGLPLYTTNPADFAGLDELLTVVPVRHSPS